MAHFDLQLISRIIRTGNIADVIEWGIQEDDFRNFQAKGIFTSLKGYYLAQHTSGSVIGVNAATIAYPGFELCDDPSMTTEALCNEVRKNRISIEGREAIEVALASIDFDPTSSLSELQGRLHGLLSLGLKNVDMQLSSGIDDVYERYKLAESGKDQANARWPWELMNDVTAGIQPDDYIVLYGRPKSKKSFVLCYMAANNYLNDQLNVLVYTKEMPAWQIFRRLAAFMAEIQYDDLRLGRLNPMDKGALEQVRNHIKERAYLTSGRHNLTVLSGRDAPAGTDSMSWLRGKIDKYKPDIVYIDGLYLMSADRKVRADHERVREISRAGRQMVLDTGVPLVATMQANRKAAQHQNAEFDEIAYSDAIGQDATCAIRVIGETKEPTIAMVLAGSREYQLDGFRIWGMPCVNFKYKEVMSAKDIEKAKQADATEEEAPVKRLKPITKKKDDSTKKTEAAIQRHLKNL